jgi:hypothetical protein
MLQETSAFLDELIDSKGRIDMLMAEAEIATAAYEIRSFKLRHQNHVAY